MGFPFRWQSHDGLLRISSSKSSGSSPQSLASNTREVSSSEAVPEDLQPTTNNTRKLAYPSSPNRSRRRTYSECHFKGMLLTPLNHPTKQQRSSSVTPHLPILLPFTSIAGARVEASLISVPPNQCPEHINQRFRDLVLFVVALSCSLVV